MRVPEFGIIYSRLHEMVAPASFGRTAGAFGYDAVWVTENLVNQLTALGPILVKAEVAHARRRFRVGNRIIESPL